ncbi:MAG: UbiD family decarboxylase, partial [Candidatus Eremiobacterota bacterium]
MAYRSMAQCVADLERVGQLRRVEVELDARLEIPAVQRLSCAAGGPALLFTRVRGCRFPMLANLFGTRERARYVLRHGYRAVEKVLALRADPRELWRRFPSYLDVPFALLNGLPRFVADGPVLFHEARLSELPQLQAWPGDGGAFVTLPVVYTEDPDRPGWLRSNLGMYRAQISGGDYLPDRECGLHYQLHRGIGVHHYKALQRSEPLRVCIGVGGPPACTFAAVMPLPEGVPEVALAGILGGAPVRLARRWGFTVPVDMDFCILGRVLPGTLKPEGPFGDHLGYYSLRHDFPVLQV